MGSFTFRDDDDDVDKGDREEYEGEKGGGDDGGGDDDAMVCFGKGRKEDIILSLLWCPERRGQRCSIETSCLC